MGKSLELLAPAGDKEAFLAAVENGADAVYLGGKILNARQFAGNFGSEELSEAIRYAHVRNVKVYLTMNTLVSEEELSEALNFAKEAYLLGIDAIIVQDLGFAGLLHRELPDLHLHASTQMTVYNLEGVKMLESLGFKRVVLARELSIDEIKHICESTNMEVEVFIHGALCISYSGQCLMSSIIGGRSGNRGKCAQPCRLPYSLVKDNKIIKLNENKAETAYLLSPKDICTVEFIDRIAQTGVKSLKIEGRMKNPEYVATVVNTYSKYLNGIDNRTKLNIAETDKKKLTQIFNRGGFSKGYFLGKTGRDMMCWEKPKNWGVYAGNVLSYTRETGLLKIILEENLSIGDGIEIWNGENESPGTVVSWMSIDKKSINSAQAGTVVTIGRVKGRIAKGDKVYKTSDKLLISEALESFRKTTRKTPIQGVFELKAGTPAVLSLTDTFGNSVRVLGSAIPETAVNKPLSRERIVEQLQKTGATPFEFQKLDVRADSNLIIPMSEINDIRRRALAQLELIRENKYNRELSDGPGIVITKKQHESSTITQTKLSVLFMTPRPELDLTHLEADRIYLPFEFYTGKGWESLSEMCKNIEAQIFLWLPSITKGNYDKLIVSRLNKLAETGINGIMVGNLGSINYFKDFKNFILTGDYSLNVFNSFTLDELKDMGLNGAAISLELTLGQIKAMEAPAHFQKEAVVYGRIPLMTSEYCPVGSVTGGFSSAPECGMPCKSGNYKLKDRKGIEFPVVCDNIDCRSTILNSNLLFLADNTKRYDFSNIDYIRLNIFDESPKRVEKLLKLHRQILEDPESAKINFSDEIEEIRTEGFTRGHYYRGV